MNDAELPREADDGFECPRAVDLPAFVHGELLAAERVRMEAHLRTCTVCAREREAFALLLGELEGLAPEPSAAASAPPSALATRVTELAAATRFRPDLRDKAFLAFLGVLLCALLILGVAAFSPEPRPTEIPEVPPATPEEIAAALRAGADALLERARRDGGFLPDPVGPSRITTTALALLALAERPEDPHAPSRPETREAERVVAAAVAFLLAAEGGDGRIGKRPHAENLLAWTALSAAARHWGGPRALGEALERARPDGEERPWDATGRFLSLFLAAHSLPFPTGARVPVEDLGRESRDLTRSFLIAALSDREANPVRFSRARGLLARRLVAAPARGVHPSWLPAALPRAEVPGIALAMLFLLAAPD